MTKPKPSLHSNDKEGFIRAFTDEWKEIELAYDVQLVFRAEPTSRKGVIKLAVAAARVTERLEAAQVAFYSCEYPTAAVESFEACLFRSLIQLGRVLAARYAYPLGKA